LLADTLDMIVRRMHGAGCFVDPEGREWKGEFYNGQGPGLHTLPLKKPEPEAAA